MWEKVDWKALPEAHEDIKRALIARGGEKLTDPVEDREARESRLYNDPGRQR